MQQQQRPDTPRYESEYEAQLVLLDSDEGQQLASFMSDEWAVRLTALINAFEPQEEPSGCAVAATVVALRVLSGRSERADPLLTQDRCFVELFSCHVQTVGRGLVSGVSMAELVATLADASAWLRLPGLSVIREPAVGAPGGASEQMFCDTLLLDLLEHCGDSVMLVNLLRCVAGQWTGHWVVLGGFSMLADVPHVLILDVAAHKLKHHWLPAMALVKCMLTLNSRGEPRGYLRLTCALGTPPNG